MLSEDKKCNFRDPKFENLPGRAGPLPRPEARAFGAQNGAPNQFLPATAL